MSISRCSPRPRTAAGGRWRWAKCSRRIRASPPEMTRSPIRTKAVPGGTSAAPLKLPGIITWLMRSLRLSRNRSTRFTAMNPASISRWHLTIPDVAPSGIRSRARMFCARRDIRERPPPRRIPPRARPVPRARRRDARRFRRTVPPAVRNRGRAFPRPRRAGSLGPGGVGNGLQVDEGEAGIDVRGVLDARRDLGRIRALRVGRVAPWIDGETVRPLPQDRVESRPASPRLPDPPARIASQDRATRGKDAMGRYVGGRPLARRAPPRRLRPATCAALPISGAGL